MKIDLRISSAGAVLLRLLLTGIFLFFLFIFTDPFNVMKVELEFINELVVLVRLTIYIPASIFFCALASIPLRLGNIHKWWRSRPLLQLFLLLTGSLLLYISVQLSWRIPAPYLQSGGETVMEFYSNEYISVTGWFITTFCLLNIYPSDIFRYIFFRRSALKNTIEY